MESKERNNIDAKIEEVNRINKENVNSSVKKIDKIIEEVKAEFSVLKEAVKSSKILLVI